MSFYDEIAEWEARFKAADPDLTAPEPERTDTTERHDYEGWRQAWIARGLCPVDKTELDEGFCSICGWTLKKERPLPRAHVPTNLPLPTDEYAQANIDEEAA